MEHRSKGVVEHAVVSREHDGRCKKSRCDKRAPGLPTQALGPDCLANRRYPTDHLAAPIPITDLVVSYRRVLSPALACCRSVQGGSAESHQSLRFVLNPHLECSHSRSSARLTFARASLPHRSSECRRGKRARLRRLGTGQHWSV